MQPNTPGGLPGQQAPSPYPQQPFGPPPNMPQGMMPPQQQAGMPIQAASQQKKHHAWGLIISLIVSILFFLGAAGFGFWAYASRQDYKDNSDKKAAAAVTIAVQKEDSKKDAEFVEKEKNPFKEYKGPSTFASVSITYPKTWAAFVTENEKATVPVDGYFHPNFVPGIQSGTAFAVRMTVDSQTYDQVLKTFEAKTKAGKVKVSPYKAPKVPDVLGTKVEGEINLGQKDTMVLFPVRDKTLKVWTESDTFLNDFNNIILANLTFSP